MDLLKLWCLCLGDTVAAISLSSGSAAMFPQRYQEGKRQLEETFGQKVMEVIETPSALENGNLPVVVDMDFGHTSPQLVLPLGCRAEIDPAQRRVRLLEPAVAS